MNTTLVISIVLFVLSLIYRVLHTRKNLEYRPYTDISEAKSLNGCGTAIIGGFRCGEPGLLVGYVALTILFLPIFPYKCIIFREKDTKDTNVLPGTRTNYEIFGSTKMALGEILCCYSLRWSIALFIFGLIHGTELHEIEDFVGEAFIVLGLPALLVVVLSGLSFLVDKSEEHYKGAAEDDSEIKKE